MSIQWDAVDSNIRTHVGITGQRPLVSRVQRHQISDAVSLSRY